MFVSESMSPFGPDLCQLFFQRGHFAVQLLSGKLKFPSKLLSFFEADCKTGSDFPLRSGRTSLDPTINPL